MTSIIVNSVKVYFSIDNNYGDENEKWVMCRDYIV